MKRIKFSLLAFSIIILHHFSISQITSLTWAKQITLGNPFDMQMDASGNLYKVGFLNGTADFDPGPGTFTLNGASDAYIAKFDASGNFIWAKLIGGSGIDIANQIKLDASGNIYVSGSFESTVDFDPSANSFPLSSAGMNDAYILKLDNNGNFIWVKQFSGFALQDATGMELDGSGNIYLSGTFELLTDFDPGPSTFTLTSSARNAYVAKLDASGNFLWAKQIDGDTYCFGNKCKLDASGNIYTFGTFRGSIDADPGTASFSLTSISTNDDSFLLKLDASGSFIWAKHFSSSNASSNTRMNEIALDPSDNVYATGNFSNTVDFDPGAATYTMTSSGNNDVFILKLNSAGSFIWAKQIGGTGSDGSMSIFSDSNSNIYTAGWFSGTVDFDPGSAVATATSNGSRDIYFSKLTSSGDYVWNNTFGAASVDQASIIKVDPSNNIYVSGTFSNTVDFDPNAGITNLSGGGVFFIKLNQTLTNLTENNSNSEPIIFPNPTNGSLFIELENDSKISLTNQLGQQIFCQDNPKGKSEIDLSTFSNGVYFIMVSSQNNIKHYKIIKH